MKIKFGSLLLLPFALLTSCSLFSANDHRTQIIFEGEFVGDYFSSKSNTPGEPTKSNCANLKITNISKEDFDNANGLDVVQDFKSGDEPYFKLELKILNDKNEYDDFHFYNLKDRKLPYGSFKDDKNSFFNPLSETANVSEQKYVYTLNYGYSDENNSHHSFYYKFRILKAEDNIK